MKFTERFNEVLLQSGKTQKEVADFCHVSRQAITNLKIGSSLPSLDTLFLICKYLDCTSDYILGLTDKY